MSQYQLTPRAERDLDEIADHVASWSLEAAERLIDQIQDRCRALASMPETGRLRNELAPGLRSAVVGRYLIFFRPAGSGIEVVRILHGARDLPRQFE